MQQFRMRATLDNASLIHRQYLMCLAYSTQSVSNDDDRAACADRGHVALNDLLGLYIQRAGCFIEDQYARLSQQGARNSQPLPLTAR